MAGWFDTVKRVGGAVVDREVYHGAKSADRAASNATRGLLGDFVNKVIVEPLSNAGVPVRPVRGSDGYQSNGGLLNPNDYTREAIRRRSTGQAYPDPNASAQQPSLWDRLLGRTPAPVVATPPIVETQRTQAPAPFAEDRTSAMLNNGYNPLYKEMTPLQQALFDNALVSDDQGKVARTPEQREAAWKQLEGSLSPEMNGKINDFKKEYPEFVSGKFGFVDTDGKINARVRREQHRSDIDYSETIRLKEFEKFEELKKREKPFGDAPSNPSLDPLEKINGSSLPSAADYVAKAEAEKTHPNFNVDKTAADPSVAAAEAARDELINGTRAEKKEAANEAVYDPKPYIAAQEMGPNTLTPQMNAAAQGNSFFDQVQRNMGLTSAPAGVDTSAPAANEAQYKVAVNAPSYIPGH